MKQVGLYGRVRHAVSTERTELTGCQINENKQQIAGIYALNN